jgi:CRP/FNR family transcriptional regulator, cyclic AMP receptor protein
VRLHRNAKAELLRSVPLFEGCSKRELTEIGAIADELDLPAGRTLIKEGQRGREFFALAHGSVDVHQGGRKLRSLGSGDFFGEIALVSKVPRTTTITSTTPVRLLVITDRSFQTLMRSSPSIQRKVLEALARRLAPETI